MPLTRSGAGGDLNAMNGFRDMMQEMMARQETKIQEMLNAHKEEVEQHVNHLFEERSTTIRTNGGGADFSEGSGHRGGGDMSDHPEDDEEEVVKVRCTYKDFNGCHPPTYDGTPNPIILHNWVNEMEMTFTACQCLDNQRANLAITKLKGDALEWWLDFKETATPKEVARLSWEEFLERLKSRFCTIDEVRQLEKEFLSFKKGSLTISEYNSRFRKLMSFSRRLVPDEATKVAQYVEGLPFNIQMSMADPVSLQQAMRRAISLSRTVEDHEKSKEGSFSHKRKLEETAKGKGEDDLKNPRVLTRSKSWNGRANVAEESVCFRCGETGHMANKCPSRAKCFECNEMGHLSYTCPNKKGDGAKAEKKIDQKAKGRAFQMKTVEACEETDTDSGTFLVNSLVVTL